MEEYSLGKLMINLFFVHHKPPSSSSCRTKQCAPNERCVEENGIPQCIRNPCKDCQGERFNPVSRIY